VNRKTYALATLALLAVAAVAVAGCGGASSSSGYSGSTNSNENASSESGSGPGNRYGGGSQNKNASSESSGAGSSAEGGAAVVSLGSVQGLGMVLVDSQGMTLYDFHKDKGTTSSCYGACAKVWPPLLSEGKPQVGNGASASKLGTTERKDGTAQVTYAGHPLYTYVADQKPGEAKGNDFSDFGGEWYALQGSGEEPED